MNLIHKLFQNPPDDRIDTIQSKIITSHELHTLLEQGKVYGFSTDLLNYMLPEYTKDIAYIISQQKDSEYVIKKISEYKMLQKCIDISIYTRVYIKKSIVYHIFEDIFDTYLRDMQILEDIIKKTFDPDGTTMLYARVAMSTIPHGLKFVFSRVKKTEPDSNGLYPIDILEGGVVEQYIHGSEVIVDFIKHALPDKELFDVLDISQTDVL